MATRPKPETVTPPPTIAPGRYGKRRRRRSRRSDRPAKGWRARPSLLREAERLERAAAAEEAEVRRKREKAEALSKGEDVGVALALRVKEASENDAKMD
ncbi:hypothetical protein BP00DRAFT_417740 [Aspergillus indologenus CBS 114.80]|uniref:Uncharacterized protein n=1 Tax=Aspergillus indologenus CBS 114.80 TaxID=1450541 RepID=A0A2V5HYK4_9EURO|nr:hypothetical protein BP00DRAFT_417740 [Aspergillus indologenus CBS 114.80]